MFRKTNFHIFLLILLSAAVQPCFSSGASEKNTRVDGTVISARGALGRLETAPSGPLYTGDGGRNVRLAVLAPQVQGEAPSYLPIYIQGLLNNNFNKYSAINLIDRQNLDRIISEQNLAASGSYSENDFVKIGNLTNAQYFLFGTIQKLLGDMYSLQLSVTDSSTGVRRANFMKNGTLSQLEGRGTLINQATAELLSQLGIQLTETGKQTLLAGNTSVVKAEAGLARGITAQAGGLEIEALFNFTQAITFDPSKIETLLRLNTLSSTISGGTISQKIVNDLQARDRWIDAFKETTRFFNDHPPFEIIFDPNLIQIGQTDYASRTANIGMRISLDPSKAGFDALNALLEGLEKTGRRGVWGFSGWPLTELSPKTTGTVVFGGKRSFSYKVDVALINEKNKTIGNSSVTLTTETINFYAGDRKVTSPLSVYNVVSFQNVKAEDLTPTLTIVIRAVNGISSRNLNDSGYMKIETGDVEQKEREAEKHKDIVRYVAFSPDGKQIVSGSDDKTIKLWDVTTGRVIRTFSGHTDIVKSVEFSPDGKQIRTRSDDNTIKLWDVATGRLIRTFSDSDFFSPDGKQILHNDYDNKTSKLCDVATGREIRTFSGTGFFSPDGKQILTSSYNKTIKLWDVATGREIRTFSGNGFFDFSPDGKQILTESDKTSKLWDAATGREIRTFSGTWPKFSPDGKQILTESDKTMKLWDVATGREIRTFSGSSTIFSEFSPDGKQILYTDFTNDTSKLWDVATGREIRTFSGYAKFSPDGKQILHNDYDNKTSKLCDAVTGREIRIFSGYAKFSPDGKQIVSYYDKIINLWDTATGRLIW